MKYLYPFFMGLYPLINLYNDNKGEVLFSNLITPSIFIIILTILSWCFFYCIFKNKEKSCIFTGISVLLFGLFNPIIHIFSSPNETSGISEWILLSLLIFVYLYIFFKLYKSKSNLNKIHNFLFISIMILLSFKILLISSFKISNYITLKSFKKKSSIFYHVTN